MSNIRYICLSDLHFGQNTGVLSCVKKKNESYEIDPFVASKTLNGLTDVLKLIIKKNNKAKKKPTLILIGDILELALNTTNFSAMVFERFIELIMPEGAEMFDDIIFYSRQP